ncbi:sensor histidine kinase [Paenibacillus sp. IB182496]|uniref:histidine kinase n=1 Tax=Paenibacillus sabuli TaxID=2772509 RepID=A0A927GUH8_9BACL|nr:sensor histidine kinase [Paenibacillus sabuli]
MRSWLAYSLRRKLSLLMLVVALIPTLSLGGLVYAISAHLTERSALQAAQDTLRQAHTNLSAIVADVEGTSIYLIGQRDVQRYLSASEDDEQQRADLLGDLSNLARSKSFISHLSIYAPGHGRLLSSGSVYDTDFHTPIEVADIADKTWTGLHAIRDYAGTRNVVAFVRPLRSMYGGYRPLGWLAIAVDEQRISHDWTNLQLAGGAGELALLDAGGTVLAATDKTLLFTDWSARYPGARPAPNAAADAGALTYTPPEGEALSMLYRTLPGPGWTLVATLPTSWYGQQSRFILDLTLAAVLLTLLLSAGLTLFLLRRVTGPLQLLTRLLGKVDPDKPLPVFRTSAEDEIARLGASYNRLGEHIESLKRRLIADEHRKKQADLQALQAQINPHFLYNTLSSIHWMALMKGERPIAEMVGSLSDFLRFSLNKGRDYCSVAQELAHIRNYYNVQAIRYPGRIELELVVEPQLEERHMLKLLLQPLVENAMLHGILGREGKGVITVLAEERGATMRFVVADDGAGMTPERLQAVREGLHGGGGYGLRNVNERLVLHYGLDAALHIDSRAGGGTRIRFTIPKLEAAPDETDDRGR